MAREAPRSALEVLCTCWRAPSPVIFRAAGRIDATREALMRQEYDPSRWGAGGKRIVRQPGTPQAGGQMNEQFERAPGHG